MRNDEKISKELQTIAKQIENKLKHITETDDYSFSLVIFSPVQGERLNYISSCERGLVIEVWKMLIKGWEKGMPDIPTHELQ